MKDYCPKCDRVTEHVEVESSVFKYAILCLTCATEWEAMKDRLELALDKDRSFIANPPE